MATSREAEIKAREDAIKRRLEETNKKNKDTATKTLDKRLKDMALKGKYGKVTEKYQTQQILGADKGFTKSDYGVGAGAAIPYQIGTAEKTVSRESVRPEKPRAYKPKPKSSSSSKGHTTYTVKRGDNLSSIAKKYGMSWKDIWNYNLKNRKPSTVKTLKKRGPNLIYSGSKFYIPKK